MRNDGVRDAIVGLFDAGDESEAVFWLLPGEHALSLHMKVMPVTVNVWP